MAVTLAPLYQAIVSGMYFDVPHCDLFGDNEIHLGWWSPDGVWREPPSIRAARLETPRVNEFFWAAREQSHSAIQKFTMPAIGFWENDPGKSVKSPFVARSHIPLFVPPAPSVRQESVRWVLRDVAGDSSCSIIARFFITRELMQFKDLP
jgi:hypothetical protein